MTGSGGLGSGSFYDAARGADHRGDGAGGRPPSEANRRTVRDTGRAQLVLALVLLLAVGGLLAVLLL